MYRTLKTDGTPYVTFEGIDAQAQAQRTANALKRPVAVEWVGLEGRVETACVLMPAKEKGQGAVSRRLMERVRLVMQVEGMTYDQACRKVADDQTALWTGEKA